MSPLLAQIAKGLSEKKESEVQTIRTHPGIRGPILKLMLLGLLVIGLAESEALAQTSGTWPVTGNLNTGRLGADIGLCVCKPAGEILLI